MKTRTTTRRWMLILLPIAALLFALLPEAAVAATTMGGDNVNISQGKVIHDDLYLGGQNVNMNGIVAGNLIAAGGNVNVNGRVNDTILAAGGTVSINGGVGGSAIMAGGTLKVTGHVARDVTTFGGTVTLSPTSLVGRDVLSAAGTTVVQGKIARNLRVTGGTVELKSGAIIGGDLIYRGNNKPVIPAGVTIQGQVRHEKGGVFVGWSNGEIPWFSVPGWLVWLRGLVGLLALGLLFVWLAPKYSRRTVATMETRWLASLGWGLLVLIVAPILAALIFGVGLLVGGWWLGLIALFVYAVALVLSATVAGLAAVTWISTRARRPIPFWAAMIAGVVLFMLVGLVPYLGWIACAIGIIWALGGLTIALFQRPSEPAAPLEVLATASDGSVPNRPISTPVG